MLVNRFARFLAAAVVMAGTGTVVALPASAATHRSHHTRHTSHHARPGIPQHNGGDRDVDNNGAPSDGDGNV
jgi:hypothetical protein